MGFSNYDLHLRLQVKAGSINSLDLIKGAARPRGLHLLPVAPNPQRLVHLFRDARESLTTARTTASETLLVELIAPAWLPREEREDSRSVRGIFEYSIADLVLAML